MDSFYVSPDMFWEWFDRQEDPKLESTKTKSTNLLTEKSNLSTKRPNLSVDSSTSSRYFILYGPHKPGKKVKTWEGDGYLSLIGDVAHICDLRGRLLEEPTLLDPLDYATIKDLGEIIVGKTEVKVVEKEA